MNDKITSRFVPAVITILTILCCWIATRTYSNSIDIATLTTIVNSGKQQRLDAEKENKARDEKLMDKLEGFVSKREYDPAITQINLSITELRAKVLAMELEIIKLKK